MKEINKRLILIWEMFFNKNVSEFARATSIPQTTLSNIVANKLNSPSAENLEKLLKAMPDINERWLLTGEGGMQKLPPYLCHYIKFECLTKVLRNMTLRYSKLSDSHNIKEKKLLNRFNLPIQNIKSSKGEIDSYSFLSFIEGTYGKESKNHQRIWIQYANNQSGVCIEVDTQKLIEKNGLNNNIFKVKYEKVNSLHSKRMVEEELQYKDEDFWQENEYRIISKTENKGIDIRECVTRIYLGNEFDKKNIEILAEIISDKSNKCYMDIMPRHFWSIISHGGIELETYNHLDDMCVDLENYNYRNEDYKKNIGTFPYEERTLFKIHYMTQKRDTPLKPDVVLPYEKHGIPYIDLKVAAGFGTLDFKIEEKDIKEYYIIPKFQGRKIDFMIEISGSSMYPKYSSGDIIACTIIRDSKFIQWNKPHVIATRYQGLLVKRILENKSDPDRFILVSDNKGYPDTPIPKDEILDIALVVGVVRVE
ncbi:MAG: DUF2971 domain-containing protein [Tannerella sp.]|jgi:phage repressor protein C with HTH and peptisase S24 domain|nr:DUF2971 domain-containing protein [Tannerella sp.]